MCGTLFSFASLLLDVRQEVGGRDCLQEDAASAMAVCNGDSNLVKCDHQFTSGSTRHA